jgi:hypothetical protein
MKSMWNDRYGKIEFAYMSSLTTLKNNLLKFLQVLYYFLGQKDETQFMRTQGWNVNAFDQSRG